MPGKRKIASKKEKEETAKVQQTKREIVSYEAKALEVPTIKPKGERLAVAHVYSSKNDTIITLTDLSGSETIAVGSGGMMVDVDSQEGMPYAAMQAAYKVAATAKEKGVTNINIQIRAPGGHGAKTPGLGAQAVVRVLARSGLRVNRIEDITPMPTDTTRRPGGRRGRRV